MALTSAVSIVAVAIRGPLDLRSARQAARDLNLPYDERQGGRR
jgi:hypothetical protein